MSIERRNPLPVGNYWVDVFEPNVSAFEDWLDRNRRTVGLRSSEAAYKDPSGSWYKFTVIEPTNWEGPGFPSIIPASEVSSVQSSADTSTITAAQKAAAEDARMQVSMATGFLKPLAVGLVAAAAIVLGFKLLK